MGEMERVWYFNEEKKPICASFSDDADCERDLCIFSHDEPIYVAKLVVPDSAVTSLEALHSYLSTTGASQSTLISPLSPGLNNHD
jgi:hypothetical protein